MSGTTDRDTTTVAGHGIASASELRGQLSAVELGIADLRRGSSEQALQTIRRMHAIQRALPEIESRFGVTLKAERTRLQTVEASLRNNAPLLVNKAGASKLRSLREQLGGTEDDWWLNLDTVVAGARKSTVRRYLLQGAALLVAFAVMAVAYQLFLAPRGSDEPSSRMDRAQEKLSAGRLEEALADFQAIIDSGAEVMEAPLAAGAILTQLGRTDEAAPYLEQARAVAPSEADYYAELAQSYYRMASQGGLDTVAKAEEAAQAALQLDPNSANAYLALGGVYELQGRVGEAVAALEKASELTTEPALSAAIRMRLGMLSQRPPELPTPEVEATATGQ
ncbi:MAG: tetratricopeptide repeat protein [Anaerolineae bacterium]|nr:tetratricopeptide repeat protein [Anaerolineae bacterium]